MVLLSQPKFSMFKLSTFLDTAVRFDEALMITGRKCTFYVICKT